MKVSELRLLVALVVLAASISQLLTAQQKSPNIDALIPLVQGKGPDEVRALIIRRLGKPAREVGSGLQIEQWDVDGGVLTFHPIEGPDFEKGGVRTRLIRTNNPAALCLFGSYEMVTRPEGRYGMLYYLGNVLLSADHYKYTDGGGNLDHRQKQENNFFMLHPNGEVQVKYSPGVTPETRLEELPDNSPVATVTFVTPDRQFSKTYRIVTNRTRMSLAFAGQEMPFQMSKGWLNYWR